MKGQATITVKDKNGNIKTSVKQHNKIFNMPQILLQDLADNAEFYTGDDVSKNMKTTYIESLALKDYFLSLYVYSEALSLENPYDFKLPQLIGGRTAGTGLADYANISVYNATNDKMTLTWAWTPDKQKTIKSLALRPRCQVLGAMFKRLSNNYFIFGQSLYKKELDLSKNGYSIREVAEGPFAPHSDNTKVFKIDDLNGLYLFDLQTESNIKTIGRLSFYPLNELCVLKKADGTYEGFATHNQTGYRFCRFTFDGNGDNFVQDEAKPESLPSTATRICAIFDKFLLFKNGKDYGIYDSVTQQSIMSKAPLVAVGCFDADIKHLRDATGASGQDKIVHVPYFNTTVLNLSAPVTVEAGETITITYEITATA